VCWLRAALLPFSSNIGLLLQCMSPFMAPFGHAWSSRRCPIMGVKQTWRLRGSRSEFDPLRTSEWAVRFGTTSSSLAIRNVLGCAHWFTRAYGPSFRDQHRIAPRPFPTALWVPFTVHRVTTHPARREMFSQSNSKLVSLVSALTACDQMPSLRGSWLSNSAKHDQHLMLLLDNDVASQT